MHGCNFSSVHKIDLFSHFQLLLRLLRLGLISVNLYISLKSLIKLLCLELEESSLRSWMSSIKSSLANVTLAFFRGQSLRSSSVLLLTTGFRKDFFSQNILPLFFRESELLNFLFSYFFDVFSDKFELLVVEFKLSKGSGLGL